MSKAGDWIVKKMLEGVRTAAWKGLKVGDEIKLIEFKNYKRETGEMKYWMRVDSKNEEDRTVTGPITIIACGHEYINEGDIVTKPGEYYLCHAPGGIEACRQKENK